MKGLIVSMILLVGSFAVHGANVRNVKTFIQPKNTDYHTKENGDAHIFGVEVMDNKQFHHSKTDEDGVRMGCYGHLENGKKYSTNYVADARGYRIVPHQGLISVYPEYNAERKASFMDHLNVNDRLTQNVKYFFPDACQGALPETPRKKRNTCSVPAHIKFPEKKSFTTPECCPEFASLVIPVATLKDNDLLNGLTGNKVTEIMELIEKP